MFNEDYDDTYIDKLISLQVNETVKIIGNIQKFMLQVVLETKEQFDCTSAVDKKNNIKINKEKIEKLEQEILALREMDEQILKITK